MNRRSLLALIGLAPVASVAPMPALAATPNAQRAALGLSPIGAEFLNEKRFRPIEVSRHIEFADGRVLKISPTDRLFVTFDDEASATPLQSGMEGDGI